MVVLAKQRLKLRTKLQDRYHKRTGAALTAAQQAFTDDELDELLDDAYLEATEGSRGAEDASGEDTPLAMLLARADGLLMIAQDEARRIRWQASNEIVDPSMIAPNLVAVARELRARYEGRKKRKLDAEIEGVTNRPTGKTLHFNTSVGRHIDRNFDNVTVRRNRSPDH